MQAMGNGGVAAEGCRIELTVLVAVVRIDVPVLKNSTLRSTRVRVCEHARQHIGPRAAVPVKQAVERAGTHKIDGVGWVVVRPVLQVHWLASGRGSLGSPTRRAAE